MTSLYTAYPRLRSSCLNYTFSRIPLFFFFFLILQSQKYKPTNFEKYKNVYILSRHEKFQNLWLWKCYGNLSKRDINFGWWRKSSNTQRLEQHATCLLLHTHTIIYGAYLYSGIVIQHVTCMSIYKEIVQSNKWPAKLAKNLNRKFGIQKLKLWQSDRVGRVCKMINRLIKFLVNVQGWLQKKLWKKKNKRVIFFKTIFRFHCCSWGFHGRKQVSVRASGGAACKDARTPLWDIPQKNPTELESYRCSNFRQQKRNMEEWPVSIIVERLYLNRLFL